MSSQFPIDYIYNNMIKMSTKNGGPGGIRTHGFKDLQSFAMDHSATDPWYSRRDSNPQPTRYERAALTIELQEC